MNAGLIRIKSWGSIFSVDRLAAQIPAAMAAYINTSSQNGKVPKSSEANGSGAVNSTIQTDQEVSALYGIIFLRMV
jgi:hypothetical protein